MYKFAMTGERGEPTTTPFVCWYKIPLNVKNVNLRQFTNALVSWSIILAITLLTSLTKIFVKSKTMLKFTRMLVH
jgi:hypothetical protein